MKKIDLTDPFDELTPIQREFAEILLNDVKLSETEMQAKFGDQLDHVRANMDIRRVVANKKVAKKNRQDLLSRQKLEQIADLNPVALKGIIEIAQHGKEHNKLEACKFLLRPAMAYLEKQAMRIAELETMEGDEQKFNFTLNVTPINGSKING